MSTFRVTLHAGPHLAFARVDLAVLVSLPVLDAYGAVAAVQRRVPAKGWHRFMPVGSIDWAPVCGFEVAPDVAAGVVELLSEELRTRGHVVEVTP